MPTPLASSLSESSCLPCRHHHAYPIGIIMPRDLMPPITPFLEAHLKLVRIGCNVTPAYGVGPRPSIRTPRQKLMVVKPRNDINLEFLEKKSGHLIT